MNSICPICKSEKMNSQGRCEKCRFPQNPVIVPVSGGSQHNISFRVMSDIEFGILSKK